MEISVKHLKLAFLGFILSIVVQLITDEYAGDSSYSTRRSKRSPIPQEGDQFSETEDECSIGNIVIASNGDKISSSSGWFFPLSADYQPTAKFDLVSNPFKSGTKVGTAEISFTRVSNYGDGIDQYFLNVKLMSLDSNKFKLCNTKFFISSTTPTNTFAITDFSCGQHSSSVCAVNECQKEVSFMTTVFLPAKGGYMAIKTNQLSNDCSNCVTKIPRVRVIDATATFDIVTKTNDQGVVVEETLTSYGRPTAVTDYVIKTVPCV